MTDVNAKKPRRLRAAIREAKRFMQYAEEAADIFEGKRKPDLRIFPGAKRASMDLTRALADVRRSPYA